MPIYRTAKFTVKPEGRAVAKMAIAEFVAEVSKREKGTRLYLSLESEENPHEFLHVMAFDDAKAEEHHQSTDYVKRFTDMLYPQTVSGVTFTPCAAVGMDAPGKTRRGSRKVVKKPQRKAAKRKLDGRAKKKR